MIVIGRLLLFGLAVSPLVSCVPEALDLPTVDDLVDSANSHDPQDTQDHPRLDLEDPASWSASGEILDENHAWYRRRRDLDLVSAETVVFTPAHIRLRKKKLLEECRLGHNEMGTWRRRNPSLAHSRPVHRCNLYCCYPVIAH